MLKFLLEGLSKYTEIFLSSIAQNRVFKVGRAIFEKF